MQAWERMRKIKHKTKRSSLTKQAMRKLKKAIGLGGSRDTLGGKGNFQGEMTRFLLEAVENQGF